jgi:hypothetical protein
MFCCVGQQRHESRLLDSYAETALVFSASPRLTTGFNFTTVRNVPFHKTVRIFKINFMHMIVTKLAYFTARSSLATPGWSFTTRG